MSPHVSVRIGRSSYNTKRAVCSDPIVQQVHNNTHLVTPRYSYSIKKQSEIKIDDDNYLRLNPALPAWPSSPSRPLCYPSPTRSERDAARSDPGRRRRPLSPPAAMAYGDRVTTFEDSEKESEYGYVRKVRASSLSSRLALLAPRSRCSISRDL